MIRAASVTSSLAEDLEYQINLLKIKKCSCSCFIPTNNICGCGRPLEFHSMHVKDDYQKNKHLSSYPKVWNINDHTKAEQITDAYGDIRFIDAKKTISKFIRVDFRTPVEDVYEILTENWKLPMPKLLISVTGGAKKFKIKENMKNIVKKGIVKAALSTDAWLITGGNEEGVMKLIGEAANEMAFTLDPNKKFILLGISNWPTITNNHLLTRNPNQLNDYTTVKDLSENEAHLMTKEAALDPNHTHFILVDNSKLNKFEGEIEFRTKLEKLIADFPDDKDFNIPNIVLVVDGGPNTIKTCAESIKSNSPCLFIQDSGRCADLISIIYKRVIEKNLTVNPIENDKQKEKEKNKDLKKDNEKNLKQKTIFEMDEDIRNEAANLLLKYFPDRDEEEQKKMLNMIGEMFNSLDLLTVYSIDSDIELDEAILFSLLKARKYLMNNQQSNSTDQSVLKAQLSFALKWNRIDVARKFILDIQDMWKTEHLKDAMYMAINLDRADFVQEFIEHGFVLSKFLTYRCLIKLYNDIPKNSTLFNHLKLNKAEDFKFDETKLLLTFADIGKIIQYTLNNFYVHEFSAFPFNLLTNADIEKIIQQTDDFGNPSPGILMSTLCFNHRDIDIDDMCPCPEQNLFIYSVLANKPKLAKIFLNEGKNEIANALIASQIFRKYFEYDQDQNLNYDELAKEFENQASEILTKAYEINQNDAKLLIMRDIAVYKNSNCLQIAKNAQKLAFISNKCVQDVITRVWYNKIRPDAGFFLMLISIIFPLVAPFFCTQNQNTEQIVLEEKMKMNKLKRHSKVRNRINLDEISNTRRNYFLKVYDFLNAPVTKFVYDKILYMGFLILFCYVMLCDFYPIDEPNPSLAVDYGLKISLIEIILIIWVLAIIVQKIHDVYFQETEILWSKIMFFVNDFWHFLDTLAILFFIVGIILRFIPNKGCFLAARIIMNIDLILWFFKQMHTYTSIKRLGPKLIMIRKMFFEMTIFVLVFLAFIFAFGVSVQSIGFHNAELNSTLLRHVFYPSYFVIAGEYYKRDNFLNSVPSDSNDSMTSMMRDMYDPDGDPEPIGANVVLVIYAIYVVFLNILLVNLMIAIFSNTYSNVEKESDIIWKFQQYKLVYEYSHRPIVPPPFNLIYFIIYYFVVLVVGLLKWTILENLTPTRNIFNRFFFTFSYQYRNGFRVNLHDQKETDLIKWESNVYKEYLDLERIKKEEKLTYKLDVHMEIYEDLCKKSSSTLNNSEKINQKIKKIYKDIDEISKLIQTKKRTF